jgi:hypothetical protein
MAEGPSGPEDFANPSCDGRFVPFNFLHHIGSSVSETVKATTFELSKSRISSYEAAISHHHLG